MRFYKYMVLGIAALCLSACVGETRDAALDTTGVETTLAAEPDIENNNISSDNHEGVTTAADDTVDSNSQTAETEEPAANGGSGGIAGKPSALADNGANNSAAGDIENEAISGETLPEETPPPEIDYRTVKPNESGNIMIIMYHGLSDDPKDTYDRTPEAFADDLLKLYEGGFQLASISDLIDGNITTVPGYTPVVLTFDDSKASAFSLTEQNGKLVPAPGCMVDILNRFCEEHPGFGKAGAFYVIGSDDVFPGDGSLQERFAYLIENGFELGNHTWNHAALNELSAEQIQAEVGQTDQLLRDNYPGYIPRSLTYPYGLRPQEELRPYALSGVYNGRSYENIWGIREGQSTITANPFHTAFDKINVPRVRGSDDSTPGNEVQDLGYYLRYYQEHPERRYISDGNANRISVPEDSAELINTEAIGDRELFVYTAEEDIE